MNRDPYQDFDQPGSTERGGPSRRGGRSRDRRTSDSGWGAKSGPGAGQGSRRRSASPDYERGGVNWKPEEDNSGGSVYAPHGNKSRGRRGGRGRDRGAGVSGGGANRWRDDDYPDSSPPNRSGPPPSGLPRQGPYGGGGGRYDELPPQFASAPPQNPLNLLLVGAPKDAEETMMIEDRVRKERPCRTLFVRNIKYETPSDLVRDRFDRLGEVKTFFDLISTRGMVFITYYDVRAAILAKDSLQGGELAGRPIDVHFSLPRDIDLQKPCTRDKGQGTILLFIRNPLRPLSDHECHTRFAPYGDIKSITPHPTRQRERYIEYFDSRAAEEAYDQLNEKPLAGGMMELELVWDILPPGPALLPPPHSSQQHQYGPSPPRESLLEGPPPSIQRGYGSPYGGNQQQGPPPPTHFGNQPPPVPVGSLNDRLAQAQKVQQLLSALAAGAGGNGSLQQANEPRYNINTPAQSQYNNPPPPQQQQQQQSQYNSGPPQPQYNVNAPPQSQYSNPPPPPQQSQYNPGPPQPQYNNPPPVPQYNNPQPQYNTNYNQPQYNSGPPPPPPQQPRYDSPAPQAPNYSPSPAQASLPPALLALLASNNGGGLNPPPPQQQQPLQGSQTSGQGGAPAQVQALLALLAQQHGR